MPARRYFSLAMLSLLCMALLAACQAGSPIQADAGDDFSIQVGDSPTFDGCGSTGEIVNYRWKILEAPATMPEDAGKVIRSVEPNCSFTLDASMVVDEMGGWVIELQVRDAEGNTSTDTVTVQVLE